MMQDRGNADTQLSAWRTSALPPLALLGAVLPLYFLTGIGQCLYYLTPIEALPTYGTAWLFLAALAVPAWLVAAVLLKLLEASTATRKGCRLLAMMMVGAAAALVCASLLYCTLEWIRTFGVLVNASLGTQLALIAVGLGVLICLTRTGRCIVDKLRPALLWLTVFGALSVLTIPLFVWESQQPSGSRSGPSVDPVSAHRPNILLLSIDTLSAQHMSLYGATRPTTPMLVEFSKGAVTFDHAYANSNFTTPGVASILTGVRPWTHRALQLPSWPLIGARRASLPALLSQNGYLTAYVSTNSYAGAAKNGMSQYFDHAIQDRFNDLLLCNEHFSSVLRYACVAAELPLFAEVRGMVDRLRQRRDNLQYDPHLATDSAIEWLRSIDGKKPVFLWVHLMPPHSPYAAPEPWIGRFDSSTQARLAVNSEPLWGFLLPELGRERIHTLEARYDESVQYVDHYAGEFLKKALQTLGDNTVAVVTADHGESFGHGYGAHMGPRLYDELIHIPLILKLPGQREGAHNSALAEQVDIAPTLAKLAGLESPPTFEGIPLVGASTTKSVFSMNFEENPRFSKLETGSVAVIQGRWKLVRYFGALHYAGMPQLHDTLYDLAADPGETVNRASTEPEVVARLSALIATELAQHGGPVG